MPSARYYIDQAKTLLSWAHTTKDKAYAQALRQQAGRLLERTNGARAAVPDLNPVLADFNDRQMRDAAPNEPRRTIEALGDQYPPATR